MTCPQGRRASDTDGITGTDEKRWERSRKADRRRRWWVVAAFIVGLIAIGQSVYNQIADDREADRRDSAQVAREQVQKDRETARLYQVCLTRVAGVRSANVTVRVLRGAVLRTRQLRLEQARRSTDPVLRRAFLRSAAGYLRDSHLLIAAPETDCRRTYPDGYRLRDRFPDIAPVATANPEAPR